MKIEESIISILSVLKEKGFIKKTSQIKFNEDLYRSKKIALLKEISLKETSISSTLERILFGLTETENYTSTLVLGSFWGYSSLWLATNNTTTKGLDISILDLNLAQKNMLALKEKFPIDIDYLNQNVLTPNEYMKSKYDLIFVDIDVDGSKLEYIDCIKYWNQSLNENGIFILHDSNEKKFQDDFKEIHNFLDDNNYEYLSLPIDSCGIDLVRKK